MIKNSQELVCLRSGGWPCELCGDSDCVQAGLLCLAPGAGGQEGVDLGEGNGTFFWYSVGLS